MTKKKYMKQLAIKQTDISATETVSISRVEDAIAEIEQLNENDYPQMDRTITKFKDIVLDIICKHTGIEEHRV